jgi:hypothetical protein
MPLDPWAWIWQFNKEARACGDAEGLRLYPLFIEGFNCYDEEPQRTLAMFREGRQIGERRGDRRWVLFFDHWILEKMLGAGEHVDDFLAIAVRATAEVRKSEFNNFLQRFCLYDHLIRGYQVQGSRNYIDEIEAAIALMEKEDVSAGFMCAFLQRRFNFEVALKHYDRAEACALRRLEFAEASKEDGYRANSQSSVCWLSAFQGDYARLEAHARVGEEFALRLKGRKKLVSEYGMWLAVAARARGDQATAQRLFRSAIARMTRIKNPSSDFYDAWCEFHELAGDYAKALKVRDRQLGEIVNTGRIAYEWCTQLARCRLLARLGNLGDADIDATRGLAQRFRKPEMYLPDLHKVIAGDLLEKW